MSACATLLVMPSMTTTRQLAGAIIRDERARAHLSMQAAADMWGIGKATIQRLESGAAVQAVGDPVYRTAEAALGLPRHFFTYVLADDRERIKRLPGRDVDPINGLHEDLRHYVIEALEDLATNPGHPHRRASDL
jgi:transcriptional regulator with XRE-family HTH domain